MIKIKDAPSDWPAARIVRFLTGHRPISLTCPFYACATHIQWWGKHSQPQTNMSSAWKLFMSKNTKPPKVNCEVTTDSYRLLNHPHPAEHGHFKKGNKGKAQSKPQASSLSMSNEPKQLWGKFMETSEKESACVLLSGEFKILETNIISWH